MALSFRTQRFALYPAVCSVFGLSFCLCCSPCVGLHLRSLADTRADAQRYRLSGTDSHCVVQTRLNSGPAIPGSQISQLGGWLALSGNKWVPVLKEDSCNDAVRLMIAYHAMNYEDLGLFWRSMNAAHQSLKLSHPDWNGPLPLNTGNWAFIAEHQEYLT